jgi:hypothetical protein
MASIVVSGDTSGTVTLSAPAVAGTTTLTLPTTSGTVLTSASSQVTGPAFSAFKVGSSNTGFSNSTATKVILDGETFDTANCFDSTTNYRFTPTVAGYYQIQGCVATNWLTSQFSFYSVSIYKNGSEYVRSALNASATLANYPSLNVSSVIYFNGSTDYVELYVFSNGGTGPAYDQGSAKTYMTGCLLRTA